MPAHMKDFSLDPSAIDYTCEATYAQTRPPVEEARTLIPDAYRSERFFEEEKRHLWYRSWVCIGYTCDIDKPGDIMVGQLADQSIIVTRDKSDELHAFYNVCRHRGSVLCEEKTNCRVIRCPYHSWGYALDGKLLGAPYFKGLDVPDAVAEQFDTATAEAVGFRREDFGLLPVCVETWGCFVFVNLDLDARPLSEWLGDLPQRYANHPLDELVLVRRKDYTINANWKLVGENFTEYYHLPWVHPELCNVSAVEDHYRLQGPGMYCGFCTSPLSVDPNTVMFELPKMPGLGIREAQTAYFSLVFPNLGIFLLPDHMFVLMFRPERAGLTAEVGDILVHRDALQSTDAQANIDQILAFWDMVNVQDVGAVERVQRGVQARDYIGGCMCYRFEEPVHRYQNWVIDAMTGQYRIPPGDEYEELPPLVAVV